MFQKIVILRNLLSFTFVVSQPLFYLLALANAQKTLRPSAYIEPRNLLVPKFQLNLRAVYYTTLFTNLFLILVSFVTNSAVLLATSMVAAAALFANMILLFRGKTFRSTKRFKTGRLKIIHQTGKITGIRVFLLLSQTDC